MSDWAVLCLAVIAAASLVTAIVQIGVLVAAGRLARRIERLAHTIDRELIPFFGHVNGIGRDAARAVSLAAAQVERTDQLLTDLGTRLHGAMLNVQAAVGGTAREGAALMAGVRAALGVLRDMRASRSQGRRADEEEGLFI